MAGQPDQEAMAATEQGPPGRFRSWRGFLLATIIVNALFVYGMLGAVRDPAAAAWLKALSWLPFNVIASVLYLVFVVRLSRARAGAAYACLCVGLILGNWIVMFSAG